jgi:DNA-directed RNA polymerase specialized sigma24 family protein
MTEKEFNEVYYPRYLEDIRNIARKYAKTDNDLFEDLLQEGLLALFRCDIATVRSNESAFVRQAVKFRIVDFLRRSKIVLHESLDTHLQSGRQLAKDMDGNFMLTHNKRIIRNRIRLEESEHKSWDDLR